MSQPTAPIAFDVSADRVTPRLDARRVGVDERLLARLRDGCTEVVSEPAALAECSRDWWPLAMSWALEGQAPALASAVARPRSTGEVAAVLQACNSARVPVTAAGGRSGVCGASVPLHGGVVLDLTGMAGLREVDDQSLVIDVLPGTFGSDLEASLREEHGLTLGHWPQSIDLSTVGGWLACRSAGQLSTRYGKIEDMAVGLEVALADGRVVWTGGAPRAAAGPDLTQLFVGSEGMLGVITGAQLRVHPAPPAERRCAYGFDSFVEGLEACRRIMRRGATPAVLRLYDAEESQRNYGTQDVNVLLVLDEGDRAVIETAVEIVAEECRFARRLDAALVGQWLEHRNDVSALEKLTRRGYVVDTMEVAGRWGSLPSMYEETVAAIRAVEGTLAATAHQSHAYVDGACLYFTFAGSPPAEEKDHYYRQVWDAGTRAVLRAGGALSHHHGVGLNRARFVRDALGPAFDVLASVKNALDPNGILNPGKLGLPSPFGEPGWP